MPTPLFSKTDPIQDGELEDYRTALENTQGNILKSHGRHFTINVFLRFTGDGERLKAVVRTLRITSAGEQSRQKPERQDLFMGLGLSSEGYTYLGYDPGRFASPEFQLGMHRPGSHLMDTDPATWEEPYWPAPHAMVLLAHSEPAALEQALSDLRAAFGDLAVLRTECGMGMYEGDRPKEHFGFLDGISQPLFFQSDIDKVRGGRPSAAFDPAAGASLVLRQDPFSTSETACGSYYVFRKLEQNVAKFKEREGELRDNLVAQSRGIDRELAGALVVGRFRDGTPVLTSDRRRGEPDNDFSYRGGPAGTPSDSQGRLCPFSAHIRKVNPRGDTGDVEKERSRRIARRGITYGDPDGGGPVGLLFQCCQKNLAEQFEFMQAAWCNLAGTPRPDAGIDPIAGQAIGSNQQWPLEWNTGLVLQLDFGGFVTLKGGAYFFLPSCTFLREMPALQ